MSTLPFGSGPSKLLEVSWAFCHLLGSQGRRGASELNRQAGHPGGAETAPGCAPGCRLPRAIVGPLFLTRCQREKTITEI